MTPASPIAALVDAAAEGDQRAWNEIVDRYTPLVLAVIYKHRLRPADAADVNQTLWLRLVEQIGRLRDPEALPGWISTTTRNECLRMLRLQQRTQPFDPVADEEQAGSVDVVADLDEEIEAAQRRQALRDGFRLLSEQCRELLARLMTDPPPSYAKVSEQLAMPVGSIGPTRIRCLDKLRKTPAVLRFLDPRPPAPAKSGSAAGPGNAASPGNPARSGNAANARSAASAAGTAGTANAASTANAAGRGAGGAAGRGSASSGVAGAARGRGGGGVRGDA